MNLLAIDTSTEYASIALSFKGQLLSKEQDAQRSHAQALLPMIDQLLGEAELSLSQLDAIVYGEGPGSFTGLRIACSVAKGLAFARDLPLYPVSTLAAIANETFESYEELQSSSVLAVIDARMNQLYWAIFQNNPRISSLAEVSAAADIGLNFAENSLNSVDNRPITQTTPTFRGLEMKDKQALVLAGIGYESYLPQFTPALQAKIANYFTIFPKASAMIRLVLNGAIAPVNASEALPVYIRNQITQGESRG